MAGAPPIDNRGNYRQEAVVRDFDRIRRIGEADFVNREELDYFLTQAAALVGGPGGGKSGGTVIDCGAGTGKLSLAFARQGWRVTALDQSAAMLERLRDKAAAAGLEITCRQGDLIDPLPAGWPAEQRFDVAVSSRVMMHVSDPAAMVARMAGFARCGIIFDAPRRRSPNRLLVALRALTGGEVYHCFGDRALLELCRGQGLRVTDFSRRFTLPIGLHLRLRRPELSQRLEAACALARPFASTAFVTAVPGP